MNSLLLKILHIGVEPDMDSRRQRLIRVSNLIYFTIGFCCVVVALISLKGPIVAMIYSGIAVVSFSMLGMNASGYNNSARIIFTLVLNVGILVSSALCESTISFAGDRLFFLVNIALASVLFDFSEKKQIVPIYAFLLFLLVGFDDLRSVIEASIPITYPAIDSPVYLTKFFLAGVTVALCFFYLQSIYAKSQQETSDLFKEIEEKNRYLSRTLKELEATQEQLIESNIELKQFASVISHDLKAPLRSIGTLVDFIEIDQRERLEPEGIKQLDLLKNRTLRLNNLINGILNYSRLGKETEEKQIVNTKNLVHTVIDMLAPPENITIEVSDDLPNIEGEPTRMQQLFQNLISNAIKFIDKPVGHISVSCTERMEAWQFSITDNGPGIAEKHHDRVFKIFQTLKPKDKMENTGVGLTIVKKIVEMHEGKIWIESVPGERTTFHFTIPKAHTLAATA